MRKALNCRTSELDSDQEIDLVRPKRKRKLINRFESDSEDEEAQPSLKSKPDKLSPQTAPPVPPPHRSSAPPVPPPRRSSAPPVPPPHRSSAPPVPPPRRSSAPPVPPPRRSSPPPVSPPHRSSPPPVLPPYRSSSSPPPLALGQSPVPHRSASSSAASRYSMPSRKLPLHRVTFCLNNLVSEVLLRGQFRVLRRVSDQPEYVSAFVSGGLLVDLLTGLPGSRTSSNLSRKSGE
ncbi:formin-like protein 5 [Melanotaenia boesemani]|uniref:formin-like protein 5 n=1 Tax=Melanotaenia boesemani TaxID=1250792 RepID=UPI001C058D73|nr:formin-like protein 5 [Melanotaenia boesemani]